jgi:hypothetical protein
MTTCNKHQPQNGSMSPQCFTSLLERMTGRCLKKNCTPGGGAPKMSDVKAPTYKRQTCFRESTFELCAIHPNGCKTI